MSVPPDPAASLGQAVALHQQGRLEEAAALYRAVLAAAPDNPEPWCCCCGGPTGAK